MSIFLALQVVVGQSSLLFYNKNIFQRYKEHGGLVSDDYEFLSNYEIWYILNWGVCTVLMFGVVCFLVFRSQCLAKQS